jgi:hypothetical protein
VSSRADWSIELGSADIGVSWKFLQKNRQPQYDYARRSNSRAAFEEWLGNLIFAKASRGDFDV